MRHADHLGTTAAAMLLGLSSRKVCMLFDAGDIPGWRVPGAGNHRRMKRSDVMAFAEKHGIPIQEERKGKK